MGTRSLEVLDLVMAPDALYSTPDAGQETHDQDYTGEDGQRRVE